MKSSEVVQKVRFYQQARRNIQADPNLSQAGKERAGGNLEQSISLFRDVAVGELTQAWKDARQQYEGVLSKRAKAEDDEGARWNYERLSYELASVEKRLQAFSDLPAVSSWLEKETQSGNLEHVRACCEVAPGVLRKRWPGVDGGAEHLARRLERLLGNLLTTPELKALEQAESEQAKAVLQLVGETQEVSDFYANSFPYGGNEIVKLLDNVKVSQHYNPEDFQRFLVQTVEFEG